MVSPAVVVGLLGNAISLLVYAAPLGTFWQKVKKKSAENYDALPYITTLLCKSLWTFYGALVPNGFLLVTVNGLGVLSESIYVILYLIYAPKDKKVKTMILVGFLNIGLVGSVIGIAIAVFHDKGKRRIFMGVVCAAVTIAMYVAPLEAMIAVIKTKSVEYMSFSLSFFLLLNAGCWFTFALILKDFYVIVPNAIGIATSSSQILLYMIYKNKSPLSNLIGSIQATDQKAIEMRSTDVAKTENPSLSKGNHNPKSSSLPTSLPLMRTLLQSPHETHHDFPTEQDEEDRISVFVDHP